MELKEKMEEIRTLITYVLPYNVTDGSNKTNKQACLLRLRHPKSGAPTSYVFLDGCLQELHWFKQSYGSWFVGNYVWEDGSLYSATPVDLVFVLMPLFEEARMKVKKECDQGKFRQLEEIMYVDGYPGYQHLLSSAGDAMKVICEVKEIGSVRFFRLDDTKVLAWLCRKVHQVKLTLEALDRNYAGCNDKDIYSEVILLLGEYLVDEPWLNLLCNHLGVDVHHTSKKVHDDDGQIDTLSLPICQNIKKSSGCEKVGTNPRRQSKRLKVETPYLNLKEMFRKASKS